MVLYVWSVISAYVIGNIKSMIGASLDWFQTPRFSRDSTVSLPLMPRFVRLLNLIACSATLSVYFSDGWVLGWFDEFSLLIIPAFRLASIL